MDNMLNPGQFNDILIVDDIPENLQLLGNILSLKGLQVSFATNGQQALDSIAYDAPDLVLLDVLMPEMDGYEVCRQLKRNPATKDIPVIFLTAITDLDAIIKAFELGAVDYVTKPFNATELVTRVFTQLELSKTKKIVELQNELLLSQNIELKQLNSTKDKFFSIIAKDLKNPINTLIGYSEMLVNSYDNMDEDKIRKLHNSLYASSKMAYNVLDDLLLWSKLQTGAIALKPTFLPIKEAIDETVQLISNTAGNKGIELNVETLVSHQVYADKATIKTLLKNILSNAIKFTSRNGRISITTSENEEFIKITIKDTGVGMRQEVVENLFKLDSAQTTPGTERESGTGLGLIVCAEIISRNKGKIEASSQLGIGTEISVQLPKTVNK
jgi:two-component system, sensor histidine kinase and response regulator